MTGTASEDASEKAQAGRRDIASLVAAMTVDEKAALTAGADTWHTAGVARLGIGQVKMTDGPNGARGATREGGESLTPSVCIPSGSALGATWDTGTVAQAAAVVARQARQKSARVLLAPTVNLHRHPLWGRNFEAFAEDPFLSAKLGSAYIKAVQGEGVVATVKHLVCNETEHERRSCSSEVDERTLRELYLLPFEFAVREAGVQAVMTSYNRVNGRYVPDDARILEQILRSEWGFEGLVMTDWWGLCSTEDAGKAGLDIEMPGPARSFGPALAQAVRDGTVAEGALDAKVRRALTVFERFGALDAPLDAEAPQDTSDDRAVARRASAASIVLLRNDGGLLPLDRQKVNRIALIGPNAANLAVMGGGSARVSPHYSLSLAEAFATRTGDATSVPYEAGGGSGLGRAVEAAREADVAIVVVGTDAHWESEGYDRDTMDLPGEQAALVEAVLEVNPRTVVVVNTGSAVSLPFAGRAPAVLQCWFGGQELANAIADVVLGDAEPGGRLPFTWPQKLEHTPAFGNFPAESSTVRYGEGMLMGYRWYQARQLPVLYPFGHGLSYTTIAIGPPRLSATTLSEGGEVAVEVDVENTGTRPGSEVVQFYVAPPGGGNYGPGGRSRPRRALKGFAKVHLAPGEKGTARAVFNERSFAYYDVADPNWTAFLARGPRRDRSERRGLHRTEPGWYVDPGDYELQVGRSCEEIAYRVVVRVEGGDRPLPPGAPLG